MGNNTIIHQNERTTPRTPVGDEEHLSDRDKLLAEELIANQSTRQSSTLIIATVASSASLILLGAYSSSASTLSIASLERLAGFLFPIAGLLYRELTVLSDKVERDALDKIRRRPSLPGWNKRIILLRKWVLLTFLASPSAIWWIQIISYAYTAWVPLVVMALASALVVCFENSTYNQNEKCLTSPLQKSPERKNS